jgi:hypothetical protein
MDPTYFIREIRRTYDEYITETIRLKKDRKATEGLLGFGRGPGSLPCHDHFTERVEQLLTLMAEKSPSPPEVREVLAFVYDTPLLHKDNELAYWMMQAVQSLTEPLIGFLTPADAAALSARYLEAYPKSVRMPAQNKIAARLRSQAGDSGGQKKRSLLDRLRGRD